MPAARILMLAILVLPLAHVAAQQAPEDPRDVDDPREAVEDPRRTGDPRGDLDPRDPPLGPEGFDLLLDRGETGRLKEALRSDPWRVLPWVERRCQRWLERVEPGDAMTAGQREAAGALQQEGRRVARLADEALVDTRFSAWVERVHTWTVEEQAAYRQARDQYNRGLDLIFEGNDPRRALTPLNRALEAARLLGHTPGRGRALAAIGSALARDGRELRARAALREAVQMARPVRDHDTTWDALDGLYESWMREQAYHEALGVAREQLDVANAVRDSRRSQGSLHRMLTLGVLLDFDDATVITRRPIRQPDR